LLVTADGLPADCQKIAARMLADCEQNAGKLPTSPAEILLDISKAWQYGGAQEFV
jgi:hypothetical protein